MGSYIVYRLDGMDRIRGAEWIEAGSDRAALARAARLARRLGEIGGCEVWQRERRVGRVAGRFAPRSAADAKTLSYSTPSVP